MNDLVIVRIGSSLVQNANWLSVQSHEVAFEAEIVYMTHILVTVGVVVLEEQIYGSGGIPVSTIKRDFSEII